MMTRCSAAAPGAPLCPCRHGLGLLFRGLLLAWIGLSPTQAAAAELQSWRGGPRLVLELAGLDGKRYRLDEFRGRVVLVNFWATWCEPRRKELPSIQRLKERLASRPFTVLAVNLDEPETRIRLFLSRTSLDLTVLLDPGRKAARAWDARILPASFVIGQDGAIRYRAVGEIDWNEERVVNQVSALLRPTR